MSFDLYPAIDLRGGRCVRLYQGDYEHETVYNDDPVAQARAFVAAGARWLHVVDLDAARTGEPQNRDVVAAIVAEVAVPVQTSGGIRSDAAAEAFFDAGAARVVVGTAALDEPEFVHRLAARHSGKVAIGLDVKGTEVVTRGWIDRSGRDLVDCLREFADSPAAAVVVTQVAVDGTMAGPDLDTYRAVLDATPLAVIASGGVASLDDVQKLAGLEVNGRRLAGVIVGRALYEGAFGVADAVNAI